ncbi:transmembrane ascorbate ferrireductase 2-like isoform X2 [Chrysoperla carnea]|uniref:transmembrane ascorbate ferrireductase 2-like isoform X2 n=1 Tax=Chrysoperla carnea TaxID=189513 RepID=UPI001D094539|nr:transmembrane ascorbate ferrireductase 2-like isoform X2 [Chrysoperla carnea]
MMAKARIRSEHNTFIRAFEETTSETTSYAEEEHRWSCGRMCEYIFMLLFTIIFIATSFSLLVYWLCKYRDGVIIEVSKDSDPIQSFEGNEKYINLHAILMTTGLITCGGFAMMFYRLFSCCPRLLTKILHFIILSFSGALSGYGLKVAYEYHVEHKPEEIPHLRSLHSWIGIVCVALFALQYLIGFVSFVLLAWVRSCDKIRETIGTIHAALGCIILALAVCATCTALQRFSEDEKTTPFNTKALLLNVIVISFVGVLIVVVYSVRRPRTQYEAKIFVTERL